VEEYYDDHASVGVLSLTLMVEVVDGVWEAEADGASIRRAVAVAPSMTLWADDEIPPLSAEVGEEEDGGARSTTDGCCFWCLC
jgi:hypothetical protein